jgi:hypothetical protein
LVTIEITASTPATARAGVDATDAPCSVNGLVFSTVLFQTVEVMTGPEQPDSHRGTHQAQANKS